jgi:carboxymethylenebutenolidase
MNYATSRVIVFLFVCIAAAASPAPQSRQVTYKSGGDEVHAVMFTPHGKGPFPAVVVIHEWWGLNDWVKQQAQQIAEQGYVTLAVDLYRGKSTSDPEVAHELMRGLPDDRGLRDLRAAVAFLQTQKNVDRKRVGSIGWCMGGGWSLTLAEHEPALKAAVVNYGHLSSDSETLQPIHAAILGNFGGQDQGIPPADVQQFAKQMKDLGKKVDVKIYPDAGHAFENPNNLKGYRAADTEDAWRRTVAFLNQNLKGK